MGEKAEKRDDRDRPPFDEQAWDDDDALDWEDDDDDDEGWDDDDADLPAEQAKQEPRIAPDPEPIVPFMDEKPSRGGPQPLEFYALKAAVIAAQIQTGAKLADEWVYVNDDGLEAFRVLGLECPDDHRRDVRMVWPDLYSERWRMGEPKRPWPLYGLPELPACARVYLCQSEPAVHEARRLGLAATTCALGGNGVGATDWSPLTGRDVVILPRNDEAGRTFVRKVSAALARLHTPVEVRALELPGLSLHGEIFDYTLPRCRNDPKAIGAAIEDLADETPEYEVVRRLAAPRRGGLLPAPAVRTARLADLRPAAIDWLWPGRIPSGKLTLLFGGPGRGKSLIATDLAARVSTGSPWPDGGAAPRASVLLISGQDALADTVRPRLDRAGADLERVIALDAAALARAGRFPLARALDRALESCRDIRLALIDPVSGLIAGDVCAALDELAALAERRDVAVVMIASLGRDHAGLARPAALGGHALLSASRSAWLAVPDAADPNRRLLLPAKSTLAAEAAAIAYRIIDGAVAWDPLPVTARAADLLLSGRRRRRPGPPPAKQSHAARWLLARLQAGPAHVGNVANHEGELAIGTLRHEIKAAGISWRTLRRAFAEIEAISERCPQSGRFRWRLGEDPGSARSC